MQTQSERLKMVATSVARKHVAALSKKRKKTPVQKVKAPRNEGCLYRGLWVQVYRTSDKFGRKQTFYCAKGLNFDAKWTLKAFLDEYSARRGEIPLGPMAERALVMASYHNFRTADGNVMYQCWHLPASYFLQRNGQDTRF